MPNVLFLMLTACGAPSTDSPELADTGAVTLPASVSEATWSVIQTRIAADARSFHASDGGFAASLPRRHEAFIDDRGATLSQGESELSISLAGYGRAEHWLVAAPVEPALGACAEGTPRSEGCVLRLEQAREGLTEWWVGRSGGLQQGWTIEERLPGNGALRL